MFTQMRFHLKFLSTIVFATTFIVGGFFISNTVMADSSFITQLVSVGSPQSISVNTASSILTVQTQNLGNLSEQD